MRTTFTTAEVAELRKQWGKIKKIDPTTEAYKKLETWLNGLDQEVLKMLVEARINFISRLAINRIKDSASQSELRQATTEPATA